MKHKLHQRKKKSSSQKVLLVGVIISLIVLMLVANKNTSSDVKGMQTAQTQTAHYDSRPSFLSSVLSSFSSLLSGKRKIIPTPTPTTSHETVVTSETIDVTALPLGDNHYSTSPKVGYVYSCQTTFMGGGAFTQGPWINASAGTWDLTKKVQVDGDVSWPSATFTIALNGTTRTLSGNDLPLKHTTGIYPIQQTDEAYNYDRNPHTISAQTVNLSLPTNPTLLTTPECVGGEVGIALSGVSIFNAFDAGGRDAVATEVQDHCGGHPQEAGAYHYHGYSDCFEDTSGDSEHSQLVGYALDGFGIYGLKGENGVELATANLDVCHGHTHTVDWDGADKEIYHYHMTRDFPYSVGCFRGKAVKGVSMKGTKTNAQQGKRQRPTRGASSADGMQGRPPLRGQ